MMMVFMKTSSLYRLNSVLKAIGLWKYPPLFFHKEMSIGSNLKVDDLFRDLGVSGKVCRCLAAENITIPTSIQHQVLPTTLVQTQHCIIQSPTGSGKTLAFLIPALQDPSPGLHSLIIVPSRELAIQIQHLAGKLISRGKLSRSLLTLYSGGSSSVTIKDAIHASPNIIIGTPKRVLEVVASESSMFKSLRRIILDEVDKLLPSDENKSRHGNMKQFRHQHTKPTSVIMKRLTRKRRDRSANDVQCIASSATINEDLISKLVDCGWSEDYQLVSTSEIEKLTAPKSIRHGFILDSSDANSIQYNKLDTLTAYLRKNPGKAMIVIHRNAPISTFVFELKQREVNAVALHEQTLNATTYSSFLKQFQSGIVRSLYCYANDG